MARMWLFTYCLLPIASHHALNLNRQAVESAAETVAPHHGLNLNPQAGALAGKISTPERKLLQDNTRANQSTIAVTGASQSMVVLCTQTFGCANVPSIWHDKCCMVCNTPSSTNLWFSTCLVQLGGGWAGASRGPASNAFEYKLHIWQTQNRGSKACVNEMYLYDLDGVGMVGTYVDATRCGSALCAAGPYVCGSGPSTCTEPYSMPDKIFDGEVVTVDGQAGEDEWWCTSGTGGQEATIYFSTPRKLKTYAIYNWRVGGWGLRSWSLYEMSNEEETIGQWLPISDGDRTYGQLRTEGVCTVPVPGAPAPTAPWRLPADAYAWFKDYDGTGTWTSTKIDGIGQFTASIPSAAQGASKKMIGQSSYLELTSHASVAWGNIVPGHFSICTVSRYSPTGSRRKRIFTGTTKNWLHGHWNGEVGVSYYEGWAVYPGVYPRLSTNWVVWCGMNTSPKVWRMNGRRAPATRTDHSWTGHPGDRGMCSNSCQHSEASDSNIMEIITWSRGLSSDELNEVVDYLDTKLANR